MDNLGSEEEVFAAATAPEEGTSVVQPPADAGGQVQDAPAPADAPENGDAPASEQAASETRQNGGDLNVALRREREERRRMQEQNAQLMQMLQRQGAVQSPQQPEAAKDPVQLWEDPEKWGQTMVQPVISEVQQTREFYSRRLAEQSHGAEKVNEAYAALDGAISRGEIDRDAVLASLSRSMDPYGDIMGWFDNQPANAEKRLREKIMEELRASGQIPAQGQPEQHKPPSAAPSLPSLNRAIGNAGATQSSSITDEDIFNAAPAFGRRKA